jgi:hypothetical protein
MPGSSACVSPQCTLPSVTSPRILKPRPGRRAWRPQRHNPHAGSRPPALPVPGPAAPGRSPYISTDTAATTLQSRQQRWWWQRQRRRRQRAADSAARRAGAGPYGAHCSDGRRGERAMWQAGALDSPSGAAGEAKYHCMGHCRRPVQCDVDTGSRPARSGCCIGLLATSFCWCPFTEPTEHALL